MKRLVATLLLVVLLLSGGLPASAAGSANPDSAPTQSLGQFHGNAAKPANLVDVKKPEGALQKLSSGLLPLADQTYLPKGVTLGQYQEQLVGFGSAKMDKTAAKGTDNGVSAYVYITVSKSSDLSKLTSYGKIANQKDTLAALWVNAEKLQELSAQTWVVSISEVTAPVVNKQDTSEGVGFHKANLAHALTTGAGVKIGVISDGVDSIQVAKNTGDLPSSVTVLSNEQGGDEGTAMLEIVYDMAPGAKLYFHDCGDNVLAFNEAVDDLIAAGCTIVVDDIGWILEPFFEDGVIASHFKEITAQNKVLLVSSAGNAASSHYQGVYTNSAKYNNWHDFSHGTSETEDLYFQLGPGRSARIVLQWKEPFDSTGLSDYDLYVFNMSTGAATASYTSNADTKMPMEAVAVQNSSGSYVNYAISVKRYNAPTPKELEVYVYGAPMYTNNIVKTDSIFGHAAVPGVIACGAIDAVNPGTPPTIESFSSQGPVTTLTGKRNKPDVCGADGVNVTGAGGFSDPFYGTSAAAPHIAAIAALIKARFPTYTPTQIASTITKSSTDLGTPGYDTVYGYGLTNAYAAVNSAYSITVKANNTSYGSVSGGGSYAPGAQATVKAVPKAGYRFVRWLEGTAAVSTSAEYKFTASKSRTLTAEFAKIATPVNLKAVSTSYNSIKLTWTSVSVAAKYEVYRATSSTGTYIKLPDVSSPSYTGTGLVTGKTYYYKVRAKFIAGSTVTYGGYSAVVPAKAVPATPTVKVASTTYNSVKLTWAAVAGATKYEIYRASTSTGKYTKLTDVSSASYTGSGLTTGKAYYYKVRAYRQVNGIKYYGGYSVAVKATPLPARPTGLKAAKASSTSVKLTWAAVTGAMKYEVYRATSATGTYYKSTETTALSFVSGKLTKGKTYYYKVRAYRIVGTTKYYGPFSSVVAYKHY